MEPTLNEIDLDESLGFFFRRLGEIAFSDESRSQYPGSASSVAVASNQGCVFFSDANGVYAARTEDLISNLTKWSSSEDPLPPANTASVCRAVLPITGGALLSLAADASILAVSSGQNVYFYGTHDLVENNITKPSAVEEVSSPILSFEWRPGSDAGQQPGYALCTENGSVLVGGLGRSPLPLPAAPRKATCVSWSPDGQFLAVGHADFVTICLADGGATASVHIKSQESEEDGALKLCVHSVHWASATSIVVSSKLVENDDEEQSFSPVSVIYWQGTLPDPSNVQLGEMFPVNIDPYIADKGSWLLAARIPQWRDTVVFSHRKSNDDHVKVLSFTEDAHPIAADITEDALAIRIPNAPGDEDNFVIGLGIDLTCTGVEVSHPTDVTAPDLPPQPVLMVGTSDGVLRLYTFGCLNSQVGPSIVQPPVAFTGPPSAFPSPAVSDGLPVGGAEDKAAETALPDEDSDFDESEEDQEVPKPASTQQQQPPSFIPKPQDFGFGPPVATATSTQQVDSKIPAAPGITSAFGGFNFGASSSTATTTASPPAFTFPAPVASATPPSSSAAASSASATITGGLSLNPAYPYKPLPPAFSLASSTPPPPSSPVAAGASTSGGGGQGFGLFGGTPPQEDIKALVKLGEQQPKPKATEAAPKPATVVEKQPVPPPSPTDVPSPEARLQGASSEVATLEADFLNTLLGTRKKEATLHDALNSMFKEHDGPGLNKKEFESMRLETQAAKQETSDLAAKVAEWRAEAQAMAASLKDAYRKIEGMPSFNLSKSTDASSPESRQLHMTHQLQKKQPLDSALESLRLRVRSQLRTLSNRTEELKDCLLAIEDRKRRIEAGEQVNVPLSSQHIYNAINAQSAIIETQAQHLDSLMLHIDSLGLLRKGSLSLNGADSPTSVGEFELGLVPSRLKFSPKHLQEPLYNLHDDTSGFTSGGRLSWRPVRESPIPAHIPRLESSSRNTPGSAPALSVLKPAMTAAQRQALKSKILHAASPSRGQVRVTVARFAHETSSSPAVSSGKAAALPPLAPLVLPELPKPYMPAPPKKKVVGPSSSAAPTTKITLKTATKPIESTSTGFAPKPPSQAAAIAQQQQQSGPKLPPIPTASQMRTATDLAAKVLPAAAKPAAAVAPKPSFASSSMPPMPSRTQMAEAGKLMANLDTGAAKPASTSQPPIPSAAAAKAAQERFNSFVAAEKKAEDKPPELKIDTKPAGGSLAGFSIGGLSVSTGSSAAASTSSTQPEQKAPAFGAAFGSTFNFASAAIAASSAATSTSTMASAAPSFGFASPTPASASATTTTSVFGAASSSANLFGAAAPTFGAASSDSLSSAPLKTVFGSPSPASSSASVFGAASSQTTSSIFGAASSAAASSVPFGQTSSFAFGGASTPAAAAPFGQQTPSLFGGAAASSPSTSVFGAPSAFGSPAPAPTAAAPPSPFGGFGTPSAVGSASSSGIPSPAGGGFGQPSAFGASPAFGAAAASPGFGQTATPGFGQAAAVSSAFGQPAAPGAASPFGQAAGNAAAGSGFASFATQAPSSGFAQFAQQGAGGGFGGFGGNSVAAAPKPPSSGSMWQPRK